MNDLKGIIEDCNKSDLISNKVIKKVIEIIGQEEWQLLHDENSDICTTIGELIITLKGIAELEAQIGQLTYLHNEDVSTIKLLNKQIEKMKNCKNCANYMISGNCPRFFRTGWCKNWEMTRSK